MHDLSRAKAVIKSDPALVLSAASDPHAAAMALSRRVETESAAIRAALDTAPEHKASLQAELETFDATRDRLHSVMESARESGRDDLLEAAKGRLETLQMRREITTATLSEFDVTLAESASVLRDLEAYAYRLKTAQQSFAKGDEAPTPSSSTVEASLPPSVADPARVTGAERAASSTVAEESATSAPASETVTPSSPSSAEDTASSPEPVKADGPDLDSEFAALMASMGETDDAPPVVSESDIPDADDIMAELSLVEVSADELPEGAEAELAKEDAEIAAARKKAGLAPEKSLPAVVPEGRRGVPAKADTAPTKPETDSKALSKKVASGSPAKSGRRVWPWLLLAGGLGGGGYLAYLYLLPLL